MGYNPLEKINSFKSATDMTKHMRFSTVVTPLLWLAFVFIIALTLVSFPKTRQCNFF